jgi:GNAT superfamily N-acetyltransferase
MATASAHSRAATLIPARAEHVPELGRICYEAFKDLQDRHRFLVDFPSVQRARQVIGLMVTRPEFYGVAAMSDGELAGSNFLTVVDEVAGVGPITVDPAFQGRDIGRQLMLDVLREARDRGIAQVRLVQEAINPGSLSLYASLGFETRHGLGLMRPPAAASEDATVRPATSADLDILDVLCRHHYKITRRAELAMILEVGFPAFAREREGRICAYLIPGLLGHGVAENEADAVALATQAARRASDPIVVFCPLDEHPLFRAFLQAGFRNLKMLNLMTIGPYETPERVWMPSVLF